MELKNILKNLDLNYSQEKIFGLLLSSKPSPVSYISKELNLPKSTVYDAIEVLMGKSLLTEYIENNTKIYGIAPKDQMKNLYQKKINELKVSQEFITEKLNKIERTTITKPKIKFYSGTDGIRHAFNDMQWIPSCRESYLMWPMQEMIDAVGEEFLEFHGKNRYKYKIQIKSIRKNIDRKIKSEWLESDPKKHYREVRYAPKQINWSMSYWIYDDKCLFATGGKEHFAFIIYSKEFAKLMKELWTQIWTISKP